MRSKIGLLRGFRRPKCYLKIFWNIPGSFRLDFGPNFNYFKGKLMKIEEKYEKSIFLYKIPHFYPLWGAYCHPVTRHFCRRAKALKTSRLTPWNFEFHQWGLLRACQSWLKGVPSQSANGTVVRFHMSARYTVITSLDWAESSKFWKV